MLNRFQDETAQTNYITFSAAMRKRKAYIICPIDNISACLGAEVKT
jgi:hypothetical protein